MVMKNTPSKQLSDLLVTRDFDPQFLNSAGKPALNAEAAEVISFDYVAPSGKDYGTVAILLGDENNMDVYFGNNLGKGMEDEDKNAWFAFLQQLRQFARRNLLSFSLADLNKLKYSMQGQAAIKEGLFESWTGTRNQSWSARPEQTRLIIKHSRPLDENDKRYRHISALFLETAEGERFKLPFTKLSGGRAMLEHVRQGGKPYDIRGQHISEMVDEINLLARFKRASGNKIFEGETGNLVEAAFKYYESVKKTLNRLSSPSGYGRYFETWSPATISQEDLIVENLKSMFIEQNLDQRVEDALPLLAKLKQQENEMKELAIFEGYLNCITEGTWALPDTEAKQQELISLLADEFPVGPDATNATEQLYDILGNDELFDQLQDLAREDANADARAIIVNFLERLKHDKNVAQVIGKLSVETAPEVEPEEEEVDVEVEKRDINEDYDAVAFVKELAQQAMVDFGYYDASELQPEELDMIAGEAQVGIQDVCDILGVKCPEYSQQSDELDERGGLSYVGKDAHWQSYKGGAKPWNTNKSNVEEMDTYPHPDSEEGKALSKAIRDPNAPIGKPQPAKKTIDQATKLLNKEFKKYVKESVSLDEHGSGVENMKGKSWQSSKAGAHPWNTNESEELEEGQMKELMWRDAERMERQEFIEHWGGDEWLGEFWDGINGEVEEGAVGGIAGGMAGAALGTAVAGPVGGAIGRVAGSAAGSALQDKMTNENLTWEPTTKAGAVTAEHFGPISEDPLFAEELARMKSLAMIK